MTTPNWQTIFSKRLLISQQIDFAANPSSIEISRDGSILVATNGSEVSFFEMETLKKIKEITVPTRLAAASLHPDKLGEQRD